MTIVRIALDIDVKKGDPTAVAEVLYEQREKILDFATAVVIPAEDRLAGTKSKSAAGNSHIHEADGDRCRECVRYSGKPLLSVVDSYEG